MPSQLFSRQHTRQLTRFTIVILALLCPGVLLASEPCEFTPHRSMNRVLSNTTEMDRFVAEAKAAVADSPVYVPQENGRSFSTVAALAGKTDEVTLSLLVHPSGAVLQASGKTRGQHPGSLCLAYQWAAETRFVPATRDGKQVCSWQDVEVRLSYAGESVRVEAEPTAPPGTEPESPRELPGLVSDPVMAEAYPELIHAVNPAYPEPEKEAGIGGVVWIKALVEADGSVDTADVYKTSGETALDSAALAAATQCRYSPAIQNGQPIAFWITYKVEFAVGR